MKPATIFDKNSLISQIQSHMVDGESIPLLQEKSYPILYRGIRLYQGRAEHLQNNQVVLVESTNPKLKSEQLRNVEIFPEIIVDAIEQWQRFGFELRPGDFTNSTIKDHYQKLSYPNLDRDESYYMALARHCVSKLGIKRQRQKSAA